MFQVRLILPPPNCVDSVFDRLYFPRGHSQVFFFLLFLLGGVRADPVFFRNPPPPPRNFSFWPAVFSRRGYVPSFRHNIAVIDFCSFFFLELQATGHFTEYRSPFPFFLISGRGLSLRAGLVLQRQKHPFFSFPQKDAGHVPFPPFIILDPYGFFPQSQEASSPPVI